MVKKPVTAEELEKEIKSLNKVATQVPQRNAGRILMKVAALMKQLAALQKKSPCVK